MSENRNIWMWVAAALLCTTIGAGYTALNYQSQLTRLRDQYDGLLTDLEALHGSLEELTIKINMKIDYGNGTVSWHNATRVPLNTDLFTATQLIADIEYTTGEYGKFIEEIDGVGGDPNTYWTWNHYEEGAWQFGPVASDAWILHNGDTVSWVYSGF